MSDQLNVRFALFMAALLIIVILMPLTYCAELGIETLRVRRDLIARRFFHRILEPGCLHHLIPPKRTCSQTAKLRQSMPYYGRTLSDASMLCFTAVFSYFFMAALVGQTAERIFTKLSHVVDIRCYLRTY